MSRRPRADERGRGLDASAWEPVLRERLGIDIGSRLWSMLEPAIRRAMARAGIADPERFRQLLSTDEATFELLVAEVTVGETYFLRDPRQLDFLRNVAIPRRVAEREPGTPFSIWSAGCATGEEAYTLAMLFEELGLQPPRIVGTDVSRARLAVAREAVYGRWSLRGVPDSVVRRYFEPVGARFRAAERLRRAVTFRRLNLVTDLPNAAPFRDADLILCRNVLIYLEPEAMRRVVHHLLAALAPGGWLLLGPSDPPVTDAADRAGCDVLVSEAGLAYRRKSVSDAPQPEATLSSLSPLSPLSPALSSSPASKRPQPPARGAAGVPMRAPARPGPSAPSARATPATPAVPTHGAAAGGAPPSALESLLADARAAQQRGDEQRASELARQYVDRNGRAPEGWLVLVRALANLGLPHAALHACDQAVERHPALSEHAELAVLRALVLTTLERYPQAVQAARGALYLDRSLAMAALALGVAEARRGRVVEARRALNHALAVLANADESALIEASGGETAVRLRSIARSQLAVLGNEA